MWFLDSLVMSKGTILVLRLVSMGYESVEESYNKKYFLSIIFLFEIFFISKYFFAEKFFYVHYFFVYFWHHLMLFILTILSLSDCGYVK